MNKAVTRSKGFRVFAHAQPMDMRKGFDALPEVVREGLGRDPQQGDLFLFVNRKQNYCKVLWWDGEGYCLFVKRLDTGVFPVPWEGDGEEFPLTAKDLQLFLSGKRAGYLGIGSSASSERAA